MNSKQPSYPHKDGNGNIYGGLTKREYFAAAALTGILQRVRLETPGDQTIVARLAVEIADETLLQLEKEGANG